MNHELSLKKIHRVIIFNQKAWQEKSDKTRQKAKNNFEKHLLKLMNNAVFGKTMENVRKHRNIEILKGEKNY